MALHDSGWERDLPLPPDLMDEPEGGSDADALLAETIRFAEDSAVDVAEAAQMIADAEPERWRIRDDDGAEWALRHLAEAQRELGELRARAQRWQERIEAWFTQAAREPARRAEFFTAHVEWWARQQRAAGRKSVVLPSGSVRTRSSAAAAEIIDPEALLEWAKVNAPALVRVREDVQVSTLREITVAANDGTVRLPDPETGEALIVPGAVVRPEQVKVTVAVDS